PPVSSGDSPSPCITTRNCALMSKPAETSGVANVSVLMLIPLRWLLCCDSQALKPLGRRDCCAQQRHPRLGRKQESRHRHARRRAYFGPTNLRHTPGGVRSFGRDGLGRSGGRITALGSGRPLAAASIIRRSLGAEP